MEPLVSSIPDDSGAERFRVRQTELRLRSPQTIRRSQNEGGKSRRVEFRKNLEALKELFPRVEWSLHISLRQTLVRVKLMIEKLEKKEKENSNFKQLLIYEHTVLVKKLESLQFQRNGNSTSHNKPFLFYSSPLKMIPFVPNILKKKGLISDIVNCNKVEIEESEFQIPAVGDLLITIPCSNGSGEIDVSHCYHVASTCEC